MGIADPSLHRYHPLLNIAQAASERADGLNHARRVLRDPPSAPRHVFQTFGLGDPYSPDETQQALAYGLGVEQVTGGNDPIRNVRSVSPPVSGNGSGITGVVALYPAAGDRDAHFERDDTLRQFTHFLATAVVDGTPTVVAP